MTSSLRFVNLGKDHILCANTIWAIVRLNTKQNKRILAQAKRDGKYLDWTCHHKTKTLILLDSGMIIGSFFRTSTVYRRLKEVTMYDYTNDPEFIKKQEANEAREERDEEFAQDDDEEETD